MATQFSFSFSGDDIEEEEITARPAAPAPSYFKSTKEILSPASAFPVQGKPLLPPIQHELDQMLSMLPSKIAYGNLVIDLDGNECIQIPRRELWDVRVQLMAEEETMDDEAGAAPGLGSHDVRTGIYEGGFKSWESSVDLVKVLLSEEKGDKLLFSHEPCRVIEVWEALYSLTNERASLLTSPS
jgi:protein-histidine N-methyltransferase